MDDRVSEWKYLQRAAELSHPEAHYQMGAYLASGMHDLEADPEQAFAHMKTAAELGSRQAPYYLGSWYRTGTGTRKDLAEADRWLAQDDSVKALIQRMLVKEELQDRAGAESLAKEAMAKSTSQKTRDLLQKSWIPGVRLLKNRRIWRRQRNTTGRKARRLPGRSVPAIS